MLPQVTLTLVILAAGPAQNPGTSLSMIERLAVETAIARSEVDKDRRLRIVIDPMVVHGDEAPGARDVKERESNRQAYLLRSFGARSLRRQAVIDCTSKPCKMPEADLLVTLSEPQFGGDTAFVTVTTLRPITRDTTAGPIKAGATQYMTMKIFLRRVGADWKVLRIEELGIS